MGLCSPVRAALACRVSRANVSVRESLAADRNELRDHASTALAQVPGERGDRARREGVPRHSSASCLIQLALRLRSNPMDVTATHSRLTSLRAHVYHHQAPTQSVT